jgi:hypothetical protein
VFALADSNVVTLQPDGTRSVFIAGVSGDSLAIAPTGRAFVGGGSQVAVYSPSGVSEGSHALPGRALSSAVLAVGADGTTVYYEKPASIGRIDGITGEVLTDFAPMDSYVHDIFPLPNGQLLVARQFLVVLHDVNGAVVRTVADLRSYGFDPDDLFGAHQIATTPDGQNLWIAAMPECGSGATLLKVSLATGAKRSRRSVEEISSANGLVVGNAVTADLPLASPPTFLALALVLACTGALLLRR